jgi:tetratricopeptide (TPR) repeat protein
LRLCQLDIEIKLYGSKSGLESMQSVFGFLKNIFGKDSLLMRKSDSNNSISNQKTPLLANICLCTLWIRSSLLYTDLKQFDEASAALLEAEKLVQILSLPVKSMLIFSQGKENTEMSKNKTNSQQSEKSIQSAVQKSEWKLTNRVQKLSSDILFQKCAVKLEQNQHQNQHSKNLNCLEKKELYKQVIQDLILANSISSSHSSSQILLGSLFESMDQLDNAELWLKRACFDKTMQDEYMDVLQNSKVDAFFNLARVYEKTQRIEKAQEFILHALKAENELSALYIISNGL